MKKRIVIPVLILFLIGFAVLTNYVPKQDLEIVTEEGSGIDQFYIENGKVYIVTDVTIKNNTKENLKYQLTAESEEDYQSGLLKSPKMIGYDENLTTDEFVIYGEKTQTFKVVFVGDHGGHNQKADRLNPEMSVNIISD